MRVTLRALALLVAASGVLDAQARPAARFVTTVEGVSEYALANGLRVLLIPDSTRPTVTANVVYFVGSRNEGYGEAGMAHLLEHLLFRGSKKHPNMTAEQTARGARRNGATTVDHTFYHETVAAEDSLVEWAIDLQADRMANALISRQALASEFTVVRNELEQGESDPVIAARNRLHATAFRVHAYQRPTVGTVSDIENVPIERLQAFYRRHYQPDNAMLIVAGRFSTAKMLGVIERKFGAIPRPVRSVAQGNQLTRLYTAEPPQDGDQYVTMRRASAEQMVVLGYHIPGVAHPDFAPLEVLADVLGSNPSGRLYKALVDTREAALLVGDVYNSADPNLLFMRARLRRDQSLDSVHAKMVRMLDSARTSAYTADEVSRARTSLLRNMQLLMGNSELFAITLADWAGAGDWRLAFLHRDRLARVTPQDVQRVAGAYLKSSNRTTVALVPTEQPDRTVVPPTPNVPALVADYKGGAATEGGEALDPAPRHLEARITRSTLPSGMHVSLLPKRTRSGKVFASLLIRLGSEQSLQGKSQVASMTAGMLMRGTATLSRQQLIDSLSKLTAAVTSNGAANSATITIETTRANLLPVLDLVADMVKSPKLDAEELERFRKERLSVFDNQKTDPLQQALNSANRQLAPRPAGHILRSMSTDEVIQGINAVTIADVTAFHQELYGGSAADFAAVGDFDPAEVTAALRRHFGEWRNRTPFARVTRTYVPTDSGLVSVEIPDKPNAAFAWATTLPLRDDDPDYPAMALAHHMIAGARTSLLLNRLREREGLTYAMVSFFNVQPLDRYTAWSNVIMVAPRNIERLQSAWRDELDRIVARGFTADEFQTYRDGFLQSRMQSRSAEAELVTLLINRRFAGRTLAYDDAVDAAIANLTVEQLNAIVKKYVDPKRIALGRAGDFLNNPPARPTP
jgi:zinc protease